MSMTTANAQALIRAEVWSSQLKEVIRDELKAQAYVNWLTDFPDGDVFTIPSIGEATVRNYSEDTAVQYDALDTGEFQFTITDYVQSGHYITNKAKQDLYYASQLMASFVPKQARAIAENLETKILALAAGGASGGQTASATNSINGAAHRFVGSGTNEVITINDFARARYALDKANVPDVNRIAIVDPTVEYTINTLWGAAGNISFNPHFEGLITSGIASSHRFVRNIFGFDVYVSNYLPRSQNETISSVTTAAGVANIFMSMASPEIMPFMGAWRQLPNVDGEYNKDFQREEFVTTARYGLKVYRPESLVVVLTDTDQVS
jgi:hypothetical protein